MEIKGRQGERKRDLPPCLPISKGHSDFPLPLMQRFQDNGLMGKTITTWLTLAPELLTELIWKSDYYPISAHIPVSDRIQAEKQEVGGKDRQHYPERIKRGFFCLSTHTFVLFHSTFHTDTEHFFSLLAVEAELKAVYFSQQPLALPRYSCL